MYASFRHISWIDGEEIGETEAIIQRLVWYSWVNLDWFFFPLTKWFKEISLQYYDLKRRIMRHGTMNMRIWYDKHYQHVTDYTIHENIQSPSMSTHEKNSPVISVPEQSFTFTLQTQWFFQPLCFSVCSR